MNSIKNGHSQHINLISLIPEANSDSNTCSESELVNMRRETA